ncbi:hypothetical protein HBZC1_17910 [Helicobacter bizzozeronii CIII-1]|uniref:Uncharacterized protein n=1 Tax=Helicobacter bizzozeronii (strain CIII-1) TaxID=1002804 RepID=F8KPP4_HELBC|nr:hypothetical protein HBZC1_17910 [Helicobacter bizzozeronii CIII-1]
MPALTAKPPPNRPNRPPLNHPKCSPAYLKNTPKTTATQFAPL